jgi:WD40 repeat protein
MASTTTSCDEGLEDASGDTCAHELTSVPRLLHSLSSLSSSPVLPSFSFRRPLLSMASHTLHPSAAQLLHSPTAVAESVIVDALTNADPSKLMPPIDPSVVFDPANTSRPESVKPNGPRRLSISDSALLARALSTAAALPQSRPGSAEAARRVRTRQVVPTSQQIVGMGGAKVEGHTEVFCLAYTPNSEQLIAGCGDGTLRVFGTASNRLERVLQHTDDSERLPVTCMRFSPQPTKEGDRLLLVAYANGSVSHWNISGDNAACLRSFSEPTSSVYAADYDADGRHFATGGRDHVIRIYDAERDTLVRSMDNVGAHGHSNRVFVVKYHPTDEPVIVTGGWSVESNTGETLDTVSTS